MDELCLLWDYAHHAEATDYWRTGGWADQWRSLCNDGCPDKIRASKKWQAEGRDKPKKKLKKKAELTRRGSGLDQLVSTYLGDDDV